MNGFTEYEGKDFGYVGEHDDYFEDEDFYDEDLCCFQLGYRYGDYCHCKAYQEQRDREETILGKLQGRLVLLKFWFWGGLVGAKNKVKEFFLSYVESKDDLPF